MATTETTTRSRDGAARAADGSSRESDGGTNRRSTGVTGLIALLAGAHFSHHVLTALIVPLIPFIRDEFGLSYAQSGIVNSAFTIAYGIAQLPAGWLGDRVGPRFLLLVGITGVAIAGALVGISPLFPLLLGGLVLMGIAGGGYHPSSSAVIARFVAPERRGRALGVHIVGGSTSHFLAPLIAAGMVSLVGWRGTFLSLAVPVALLGIAIFILIQRRIHHADTYVREQATREREAQAARNHTGPSRSQPRPFGVSRMTFFLILTGFIGAAAATVIPFIPLYLADVRGVDDRLAAGFISIIFAAGFFAAPLGGWLSDTIGRVRVMVIIGLLAGPVLALIILAPFPFGMAALLLLLGMIMFTKMPTAEAHIASEVTEKHRTTVLGIYFFSGMEGSALLTPLLGAVIDRWGFNVGLLSMAGGLLAIVLVSAVALFWLRHAARARRTT